MSPGGSQPAAERRELGDEPGRVAAFDLSMDSLAPAQARRAIEQLLLTNWYIQDQHLLDDALLLASELVTNAVRHGADRATLRVALRASAIELSVEDGSDLLPTRPALITDNAYREGGRGLLIVSALASEWGIEDMPSGGKRVWARLARTTSG